MSRTDATAPVEDAPAGPVMCMDHAPFKAELGDTLVDFYCTLELDHDDDHQAVTVAGHFVWHRSVKIVAVITVENEYGGVLDRWAQEEDSATTRELPGEPATIAVAVVRKA